MGLAKSSQDVKLVSSFEYFFSFDHQDWTPTKFGNHIIVYSSMHGNTCKIPFLYLLYEILYSSVPPSYL